MFYTHYIVSIRKILDCVCFVSARRTVRCPKHVIKHQKFYLVLDEASFKKGD